MPSRKPWVAIEMMPGTMMISERAKNRLRRPMMLSRRTFGGFTGSASLSGTLAGPSGTMSAACSSALTSDSSDTVDPQQARTPEAAGDQHDREQVVSHHDRRDEADQDADRERERESLDRRRPDEAEDRARPQRRAVGVPDRRPRTAHGRIYGGGYGSPRAYLFFEALEDQDIGVGRHTDAQDDARDARRGQRHRDELEEREHHACV